MWITKDNDWGGHTYLWKIKPETWIDRFNKCSYEYKKEYLQFINTEYNGVMPSHEVWVYPYEFTKSLGKSDYLDVQDLLELDAKYRIQLDDNLFPSLYYNNSPMEIKLITSDMWESVNNLYIKEIKMCNELRDENHELKKTIEQLKNTGKFYIKNNTGSIVIQ